MELFSVVLKGGALSTLEVRGDDTCGQVSDAPDGEFKAIAGGPINGLALRRDGTPGLWGRSTAQLGAPPIPSALAAGEFLADALGRDDAVQIHQNGSLAAYRPNVPVTSVPAGSYRAVAVAVVHGVAIATDGTLAAWWSDSFTLPDGSVVTGLRRIRRASTGPANGWTRFGDSEQYYVPGERFKSIAAAAFHVMAITAGH